MTFSLLRGGFSLAEDRIDTASLTQGASVAGPEDPRTVGAMPIQPEQNTTDPSDIFLDTEAIAARYPIGLTKAKELVKSPGFPASVVPGMVRIPLVALRRWELAQSLAGTLADVAPQHENVVVVSPPPARPAGRPSRKAVA